MRLIFVHGWSVTHTDSYGSLPESLSASARQQNLQLDIDHIHLGKYVSFHDEVTLDDIAQALNQALSELPGNAAGIAPFSCITHSTGGPVVRHWVDRYYGSRKLGELPLRHLVMLAPANHGSSLAILGKQRLGRIKAWFDGVEPGQRVLDWLSLGSEGQWQLNQSCLSYRPARNGFYPFVLTGQGIDRKFYDFLNSYLVEPGSDGVVRVAGANMNYRYLSLVQSDASWDEKGKKSKLEYNSRKPVKVPQHAPIGVFSQFSHSGKKKGIMAIKPKEKDHDVIVNQVLQCLLVDSESSYGKVAQQLQAITDAEQQKTPEGKDDPISRYSMLIFRVRDNAGNEIDHRDLDIFLLAGNRYSEDKLPKGFFVDKQLNKRTNSLVYYVDADVMARMPNGEYGVRVVARPEKGFSHYLQCEFRSEGIPIEKVIAPNEATYIDITLTRLIDKNVFRFSPASAARKSFKRIKPSCDHLG